MERYDFENQRAVAVKTLHIIAEECRTLMDTAMEAAGRMLTAQEMQELFDIDADVTECERKLKYIKIGD